jgi:hypothetical protein
VLTSTGVCMNHTKSGKEEFNEKFVLDRQNPHHDFGNGLTVTLIGQWEGRAAGAAQTGVGDPDWGNMCFYMNYCSVRFSFKNPVSKVGFSVIGLSQQNERSYYRVKEVGVLEGGKNAMPANGGTNKPAKKVLFESALGIESFVIDQFNNDSNVLFLDNLIWE